jgi:hypothetical protein
MAYATVTDLETWLGEPPPFDAARQLDRASALVDANLMGFIYPVDSTGAPTDATVITGFKNAVCAQIEWWLSNNDELNEVGQFDTYAFEGASFTGGRRPPLAPRAGEILRTLPALTRGVVV